MGGAPSEKTIQWDERGFVLVAVVWILSALATLASIYAVYAGNAAAAAHIDDDRLRMRAAAKSALELTALTLTSSPDEARSPRGGFTFALMGSKTDVEYVTESSRINLNAAPTELLTGLFLGLGASPELAAACAEHVVAWRKSGFVDGKNPEADAYRSAGYPYAPRQAPFRDVLEIGLVRGLPADLAARALPYLTIYSGRGEIDPRVVDDLTLGALPGATPDQVKAFLALRAAGTTDAAQLTRALGAASTYVSTSSNDIDRVIARVRLDDGREGRFEVVVKISRDEPEPYRILYWRDDVDDPF